MKYYEVQTIAATKNNPLNYRITEIATDSRIATCYLRSNADLVVAALNAYRIKAQVPPSGQ